MSCEERDVYLEICEGSHLIPSLRNPHLVDRILISSTSSVSSLLEKTFRWVLSFFCLELTRIPSVFLSVVEYHSECP